MRFLRAILRIVKGLYDILTAYLLAWVLCFALTAWVFYLLTTALVGLGGFETPEAFWCRARLVLPLSTACLRLFCYAALHLLLLWAVRRRLWRVKAYLERAADALLRRYRRWARKHVRGRTVAGLLFSVTVTLLLVPFVIQPTLVPRQWDARAWVERAANLADGTATAAIVESVVGFYRKVVAEPVLARGIGDEELDRPSGSALTGPWPLMDRWDPLIRRAVSGDRRAFARVKALIFVESGGEQFAVSRTGCIGLTQFCGKTARSGSFRSIFGIGQVYPCRCRDGCRVPRPVRSDLESGDRSRILRHRDSFPCDLTDARFDPKRAIRAGWVFFHDLGQELGGNLYLMYIGYNSGPAVARHLWTKLGRRPEASLEQIAPLLEGALAPHFGAAAGVRAKSLLHFHLPKIRRAFDAYLKATSALAAFGISRTKTS